MRKLGGITIALMTLLIASPHLTAWAADTVKVGVVSQQSVLERSKAGKRALDELREFSAARQRIVSADDEELKRLETELKKDDANASDAQKREKQEKQEQFRVKFENYQRRLQDFNREIQAKQKQMIEEYQAKIDQAAAAVAEKNGLAAVLDKGSESTLKIVIYASDSLDVTEQVIKEFDRQNK
jgi:outer membrane protein